MMRKCNRKEIVLMCLVFLAGLSGVVDVEGIGSQDWTREPNNPVLPLGESGSWDESEVLNPVVIWNGITYKMWYAGQDASGYRRTGYATSPDGVAWTKYDPEGPKENLCLGVSGPGCVFDTPTNISAWDRKWVYDATVLIDPKAPSNERYKMWYTGLDVKVPDDNHWRIGYATSPDGVAWTRYPKNNCSNPKGDGCVFDIGSPDDWDDDVVGAATVIIDPASSNERYKMWYEGCKKNDDSNPRHTCRIGYATSPDGIVWAKYDPKGPAKNLCSGVNGHGCVLNTGDDGTWDYFQLTHPMVSKTSDTLFKMWYGGENEAGGSYRIGYATSPDGIVWTKYPGNNCPTNLNGPGCVFDLSTNNWENKAVTDPHVIVTPNRFLIWYSGVGSQSKTCQIGFAHSNP